MQSVLDLGGRKSAERRQEIFKTATAKGATVQKLGDALAAASLFSTAHSEAFNGVQQASLNLIRRSDETSLAYFNGKWKESVTFLLDHAVALARTFFDAGPVEHRDLTVVVVN